MKKAVNFRLSEQAIAILLLLENKMHTTKTAILESALLEYAKEKTISQNTLMHYAGMLSHQDGDDMLKNIKSRRRKKLCE